MKDDSYDFTGICPLHTFGECTGKRAREQSPKVEIQEPPCTYCPHLGLCSEEQVACADFALYVDSSYQKNDLIKHFSDTSPRLPTPEVYSLIYTEDED